MWEHTGLVLSDPLVSHSGQSGLPRLLYCGAGIHSWDKASGAKLGHTWQEQHYVLMSPGPGAKFKNLGKVEECIPASLVTVCVTVTPASDTWWTRWHWGRFLTSFSFTFLCLLWKVFGHMVDAWSVPLPHKKVPGSIPGWELFCVVLKLLLCVWSRLRKWIRC